MTIQIGTRAPAFTLEDQDGDKLQLVSLRGQWVVLYFYPKDDTPGCTVEAKDFTANLRAFEKLDATVLGCSADDAESHRKFIKKHRLKITLISDPTHRMMEKYGAWGDKVLYGRKFQGVIRSTVVIDPTGKIAHHWKRVQAKGHAKKVLERLTKLQEAAESA